MFNQALLTRRRALATGGAFLLTTSCRAQATNGEGPPQLAKEIYRSEKPTAVNPLQVQVREWTRGGKVVGRIFIASSSSFDVVPSKTIRPNLAFALGGIGEGAAINGGFYDSENRAMGLVRHRHVDVSPKRKNGGSGIMAMTNSGPQLFHRDVELPSKEDAPEALQSIDRLVVDSKSVVGPRARPACDARSAIAISGGRVLLIAMIANAAVIEEKEDAAVVGEVIGEKEEKLAKRAAPKKSRALWYLRLGPHSSDTGVSMGEFASVLARPRSQGGLAVDAALNLDGGFSVAFLSRTKTREIRIDPYRATINALRLNG